MRNSYSINDVDNANSTPTTPYQKMKNDPQSDKEQENDLKGDTPLLIRSQTSIQNQWSDSKKEETDEENKSLLLRAQMPLENPWTDDDANDAERYNAKLGPSFLKGASKSHLDDVENLEELQRIDIPRANSTVGSGLPSEQDKKLLEMQENKKYKSTIRNFVQNIYLERTVQSQGQINSAFILLILLVSRFGCELINGDKIASNFGEQIRYITNWNLLDIENIVSLTYWLGALPGFLCAGVVGLYATFIHNRRRYFNGKYFQPIYSLVFWIIFIFICHGFFIIGLLHANIPLCVMSRILFGFADAMHVSYNTFIIVKKFKYDGFANAFGFTLSIRTLTNVIIRSLNSFLRLIVPNNSFLFFLFLSLGILLFSIIGSMSYTHLDMELKQSDFLRDRKPQKHAEKYLMASTNKTQRILYFSIFIFLHLIAYFVTYFTFFMFPFHFGGVIWNLLQNNNSGNLNDLHYLQDIADYSRSIFTPLTGSFLDSEQLILEKPKVNADRNSFFYVLSKFKIHMLTVFVGIVGCFILQFIGQLGRTPGNSPYFFMFATALGFFIAVSQNALLNLPLVFFANFMRNNISLTYGTYFAFCNVAWVLSRLLNSYVVRTVTSMYVTFSIGSGIILLYILSGLLIIARQFYVHCVSKRKKELTVKLEVHVPSLSSSIGADQLKSSTLSPSTTTKDGEGIMEPASSIQLFRKKKQKSHWLWLLFYFPLELAIFIFVLMLFFVGSGIPSIIVYYSFFLYIYINSIIMFVLLL